MANQTFKLEGFAELEQQLKQLSEIGRGDLVARNTMSKAAKQAMQVVYDTVLQTAPYDESNNGPIHLRDTTRLDARIPTAKDKMSYYVNETDAVIAVVSVKKSAVSLSQEFGNARTTAQPFLRIALERNSEQVLSVLKNTLGSFIIDYAAKLRRK